MKSVSQEGEETESSMDGNDPHHPNPQRLQSERKVVAPVKHGVNPGVSVTVRPAASPVHSVEHEVGDGQDEAGPNFLHVPHPVTDQMVQNHVNSLKRK